ncbi:hypothetical protein [Novipirellula caenicola]|uniref:hypothetical protein n=1 Tax=Novipirellula caenicola TaxID=1536901 RepID=UPI0031EFC8B7
MSTKYGDSSGRNGTQSLNGFGALRESFKNAGFQHRDVSRLSKRVITNDALVWTPASFSGFSPRVTRWIDRWLAQGDRTLIFVIPDSGSETDYWIDASKLAPPEQRLEYRRRIAKSINRRIQSRLNRSATQSNGWFTTTPLSAGHPLTELDGEWSETIALESGETNSYTIEHQIEPYSKPKSAKKSANTTTTATTTTATTTQGTTTQGTTTQGTTVFVGDNLVTDTPVTLRPLLQDQSGTTVVAQVQSNRWNGSQIIVVAGGSLLTNYAFTKPLAVQLADQLVLTSLPPSSSSPSAGFISVDPLILPVSESKPGVPKASGWELLTTWPMSLVTVHAALLGLVICLMLLPSLGRARHVRYSVKGSFGDHLDAVAALMNRAGGEQFARHRISEYMRRIHGETQGPWVLPEPAHETIHSPALHPATAKSAPPPGLPDPAAGSHTPSSSQTTRSLDPTDSDTTANS